MKITKKQLKQIIKEAIGGMPQSSGEGNSLPGYGYMKNFPTGEPPSNQRLEPFTGRPAYETGEIPEPAIKDGEKLVTQGKNVYLLEFEKDSKKLAGKVTPLGEYKFYVDVNGKAITWEGETPANIRFDSNLQKQILDFRGVD